MVTCLFSSGNVTLSFFKPCCSRCWSIWTVVFFQILVFNWIKFKVTFIFGLGGRKVKVKFFCGLVICIFEKSRETNFFFQNQAFNMVLRNVKLILSPITSHFYQKCKNIWQRLSDRHNLFSFFSHKIGVKIGVKNTKLSPFPWGFPKKVIFKSAPKVVVINDYGR